MGKEPSISGKLTTDQLVTNADAQFRRWQNRLLQERKDRLDALMTQNLTSAGRAAFRLRICEVNLVLDVRKRIETYENVAHKYGNVEMLSKARLAEFREAVMTTIGVACLTLKDHNERDARAVADGSPTLAPIRYEILKSRTLNVLNAELKVLETEGLIKVSVAERPDEPTEGRRINGAEVNVHKKRLPAHVEQRPPPRRHEPHLNAEALFGTRSVQTFQTASVALGLGRRRLCDLIEGGQLEAHGVGPAKRITTSSLRTYLKLPSTNLEESGNKRHNETSTFADCVLDIAMQKKSQWLIVPPDRERSR